MNGGGFYTLDSSTVAELVPVRPDDAHKGRFGHLFVLAGSPGFTGAAVLCCEAALRSGTGLVTLGVPEPLAHVTGRARTAGTRHGNKNHRSDDSRSACNFRRYVCGIRSG